MSNSTLSTEIRSDHVWILHELRQIVRRGSFERSEIRRVTTALGAHHLAEEETLYEPIKALRRASVDRAEQYHIVLDDLTHSIEFASRVDPSVNGQILLLENLLEHHFFIEEQVFLPALVGNFSESDQWVFGEEYRLRFRNHMDVSGARKTIERWPRVPVTTISG